MLAQEWVLEWGQALHVVGGLPWVEVGGLQTLQWGLVQGQVLDWERESELVLARSRSWSGARCWTRSGSRCGVRLDDSRPCSAGGWCRARCWTGRRSHNWH